MEAVVWPASVNQIGKTKKNEKPVDKPAEPIQGPPPPHPLIGA
jgi:hypothetical protein